MSWPEQTARGHGGEPIYYLWTNLWVYWPVDSSPRSRGFVPDEGRVHADRETLFTWTWSAASSPVLSRDQQAQADRRFAQAVETAKGGLAVVLTDAPAQQAATRYYVHYEPCANLVIALNPEIQVTITADDWLWDPLGPRFEGVMARAMQLLRQGRIGDALLWSIDGACELSRLAREVRWSPDR